MSTEIWICSTCTLENKKESFTCDACENPRQTQKENPAKRKRENEPEPERKEHSRTIDSTTWECQTCTLINPVSVAYCDVCEAPRPPATSQIDVDPRGHSIVVVEDDEDDPRGHGFVDDDNDDSPTRKKPKTFADLLAPEDDEQPRPQAQQNQQQDQYQQYQQQKKQQWQQQQQQQQQNGGGGGAPPSHTLKSITCLYWNIWFEPTYMQERMDAIVDTIRKHNPEFVCLQEVTPESLKMLLAVPFIVDNYSSQTREAKKLNNYFTLVLSKYPAKVNRFDFKNSIMGRDIASVDISFDGGKVVLCVATSHLESPVPPNLYSRERKVQIAEAFKLLGSKQNVLYGGDMNWTDPSKDNANDGMAPLPSNWVDMWTVLHPNDPGFTYDGRANEMLKHGFRKRIDRIFAKLPDFNVKSIQMVGLEKIRNLTFTKYGTKTLSVLPSDHFGLLCTIEPKSL